MSEFYDPYLREYPASPLYGGKRLFSITPSDTELLPRAIKKLRVLNPTNASQRVAVMTKEGDVTQLRFPPGLSHEDGMFIKVFATGTSTLLFLHGYSDGGDPIVENIDDGHPITLDFSNPPPEDSSAWLGIL